MLLFLLWREYVSWPALHLKVVELQSRMNIPFASKLLCWVVYSFFYVCMVSMCWSRLAQINSRWGFIGYLGLAIQIMGLGLESIADLQKNGFKSHNRHAWCNVGVWAWSTHPNYLGEGMFWWGSYLAHGFSSILYSLMATTGLMFITVVLKGSTRSLSHKHREKYGDQPKFHEFHRTHSIWGPKLWWWWLHGMEELSVPQNNYALETLEENISTAELALTEEAVPSQAAI
jgi:steroid 5-alpha reductase family enzyme